MRDFPRETLNITKSPCSNEGTHRSDFVTLRYIQRFPGNNQRDESIDAQERAIRKYAEENDIEIVEEYIDRSRTGTNTDREEFQRMLNDSRYGLFDLVIVHKLDRFARNRYDSAVSRKILRDNGVELYSVIEKFDNTPESIILGGLMETLNEYYSANLSREVMKGMRENALQCRYTGGYVPLGYRVDDAGHFQINEEEAEVVRRIFSGTIQGMSYRELQQEFNEKGIRTRTGKLFGKNSLYSILTNEKYIGVYVYNRASSKDSRGKRNNHRSKPDDQIIRIENGIPAIVTREEFQAVQELLKKRRRSRRGRTDTGNVYLLTGKVYCGICGGKYCGNSQYSGRKKTLYYCYRCNVRSRRGGIGCPNREISRNCLEKYVLRLLADILFDKDRLPAVIEEYNRAVTQAESSVESDRKRLKKSIKSLENEVGNIISVIARTGSESLTAALDGKEKELAELRAQLSGLERRSARVDIDEEQIKRAFDYGRELLLSGKIPRLRQLIELYVERVEILPDSVSVTLNILRELQANESGAALDRLNRTYPEALKITRKADREEVVSASGE